MTETPETWVPVADWPGYEVSDAGRVRSVPRRMGDGRWHGGTVLRQTPDRKGYLQVHLRKDGKASTKKVHTLVAEAFLGRRPKGQHILHRNDRKDRNGVTDIRYGTPERNVRERMRRERGEEKQAERME